MAHYAYLNNDNIVVMVTVGKDETELIDGLDTETYYAQGTPYTVKRTSYNGNTRKRYAGVGMIYDPVNDVFIAPQPHPSWSLDKDFAWKAPVPYSNDGLYYWDEDTLSWNEIEA